MDVLTVRKIRGSLYALQHKSLTGFVLDLNVVPVDRKSMNPLPCIMRQIAKELGNSKSAVQRRASQYADSIALRLANLVAALPSAPPSL
jgi:hypothetical protein